MVTSLHVLDRISNSILGRHCNVSNTRSADAYCRLTAQDHTSHRALILSATLQSSSILSAMVERLAEDGELDVASAERFFGLLRDWSQRLPAVLRQHLPLEGEVEPDAANRGLIIGKIHAACTYYFGVILVTRPFLVQQIMRQMQSHGSVSRLTDDVDELEKVKELSTACIEAATYMAQMCDEAMELGVLLGNMCILKYDRLLHYFSI